jgi:hypothetical protein
MAAEVDPAPARDAVRSASADGALVIDLAHQRPAPAAPAPLSPARSQLRSAIAEVTSASAALAKAQAPIQRLNALLSSNEALERQIADLQGEAEEALATYLASGSEGPRPQPSPELAGSNPSLWPPLTLKRPERP